jgi:hypothetical protein
MMDPLGLRMEIGCFAIRLLITGVSMVQKCAVLPVSAMSAVQSGFKMFGAGSSAGAGGPIVGGRSDANKAIVGDEESVTTILLACVSCTMVGFPPSQPRSLRLPDMMRLFPLIILSAVAVSWWPSRLL